MGKKRKYPEAFRRMAVERMRNCANICALAEELGVHRTDPGSDADARQLEYRANVRTGKSKAPPGSIDRCRKTHREKDRRGPAEAVRDDHKENCPTGGFKIGDQGHYPFGEQWYMNSATTKRQFTSYERDSESGNDYACTGSTAAGRGGSCRRTL